MHCAHKDLEMRLERERHVEKEQQLEKAKEKAQAAASIVFQADRTSHKAVKRAIDIVSDVEQHARLVHGAAQQMHLAARRAMAAAPAEKRARLEAELSRPAKAISASLAGLRESRQGSSREIVAASVQARKINKQVCSAMYN